MPYVDKVYYDQTYLGEPIDDLDEFERLAQRASQVIDMVTSGVLQVNSKLMDSTYISNQVKLATCAQIEYFMQKGGYVEVMSGDDEPQSVSISGFSYSTGNNQPTSKQDISQFVCSSVYGYLEGTGLLYRGLRVHGY